MACLTENAIMRVFASQSGSVKRGAAEELAHVESCDGCRQLVAAYIRSERSDDYVAPVVFRVGEVVAERYRIASRVGHGGMGIVFKARDLRLERDVALKVLRTTLDDDEARMERFTRESQVMAKLRHNNVATVHDIVRQDGALFIVMEYLEGPTLRRWLADKRPRWRDVVDIFIGAARGLEAVHAAGIVHCDFKPDNVIIVPPKSGSDERARVVVTDFGLARLNELASADKALSISRHSSSLSQTLSLASTVVGTPGYIPPEQYVGEATVRSDVFAFSVALYEAVYGVRPYSNDGGITRTVSRMQRHEWTPGKAEGAPRGLRAVVEAGLQADPSERLPDLGVVRQRLVRVVRRRRRIVTGVIAAGAAAMVAAVATASVSSADTGTSVCKLPTKLASWTPTVRASFAEKVMPDGVGTSKVASWTRAFDATDSYARNWARTRAQVCNHEDPYYRTPERIACLQSGSVGFDIVLRGFREYEYESIQWHEAMLALASPAYCLGAIGAAGYPQVLAQDKQAAVAALRAQIHSTYSRARAGQTQAALIAARDIVSRALATGYGPLRAEARYLLARIEQANGVETAALVASIRAAIHEATASRHDVVAAKSWLFLSRVAIVIEQDEERAAEYAGHARVAISRIGGPARLLHSLALTTAQIAHKRGRRDEALKFARQAERVAEVDMPQLRIEAVSLQASILADNRDFITAEPVARRALALAIAHYGDRHSIVARGHGVLGNVLIELANKQQSAFAHLQSAIRIFRDSPGDGDFMLAAALHNLCLAYVKNGDHGRAMARCEEVHTLIAGKQGQYLTTVYTASAIILAHIQMLRGKDELAVALLDDAVTAHRRFHGDSAPTALRSFAKLAERLVDDGDYAKARRITKVYVERARAFFGQQSRQYAAALISRAEVLLQLGHHRFALATAKRAASIPLKTGENQRERFAAEMVVAAALNKAGQRDQAIRHLRSIRSELDTWDSPRRDALRRSIEEFLTKWR